MFVLNTDGLGVQLGIELKQNVCVHPSEFLREVPGARVDQVGACQPTTKA